MRPTGGLVAVLLLLLLTAAGAAPSPCEHELLRARCECGTGGHERPTVQCEGVAPGAALAEALRDAGALDLLSLANASAAPLPADGAAFAGLELRALRLTGLGLRDEALPGRAFRGLERALGSLGLARNALRAVPRDALKPLAALRELDLSHNLIAELPDGVLEGTALTTLSLADNQLRISDGAFRGLEGSLRTLTLKGTGLTSVPAALQPLAQLSFLDLSQNALDSLPEGAFRNLGRLAALSLERNALGPALDAGAFEGLALSLGSLSLLNNRLEEYPKDAVAPLHQLRVLDVGFNRLRSVPDDAFEGNAMLTLLALDGNPLATLREEAFAHLNATLRGLSLGGSTLVCDCRLRWVVEWVQRFDLQVTSRERNPQFCGRPARLRRRPLPRMAPEDLLCDDGDDARPEGTAGRDLRAPRTSVALEPLRLTEAARQGAAEVLLRWEGGRDDNLVRARPVLAMYRVFGEPRFLVGTSASGARGWAQMEVPEGPPLVVCVVDSAQSAALSADATPRGQCRELPGAGAARAPSDGQLHRVIIGSSAAVCAMIVVAVLVFVCCSRRGGSSGRPPAPAARPAVKSEHEWETASAYSGRSIPRARAYHGGGSANPSYLHPQADDVQSFRSLPPPRAHGRPPLHHGSQIALSQLSGPHSFLGAGGDWGQPWDHGELYHPPPSRLSYGKDTFG